MSTSKRDWRRRLLGLELLEQSRCMRGGDEIPSARATFFCANLGEINVILVNFPDQIGHFYLSGACSAGVHGSMSWVGPTGLVAQKFPPQISSVKTVQGLTFVAFPYLSKPTQRWVSGPVLPPAKTPSKASAPRPCWPGQPWPGDSFPHVAVALGQ